MNVSAATPAPRAGHWQGLRRVLAVRLDNLGDVLMTTPALAAVRASLPGVHLALLASPAGAAAADAALHLMRLPRHAAAPGAPG